MVGSSEIDSLSPRPGHVDPCHHHNGHGRHFPVDSQSDPHVCRVRQPAQVLGFRGVAKGGRIPPPYGKGKKKDERKKKELHKE